MSRSHLMSIKRDTTSHIHPSTPPNPSPLPRPHTPYLVIRLAKPMSFIFIAFVMAWLTSAAIRVPYRDDEIITNITLNTTMGTLAKYTTDFPAMTYFEYLTAEAGGVFAFCNGSWWLASGDRKAIAQISDEYTRLMGDGASQEEEEDWTVELAFPASWDNANFDVSPELVQKHFDVAVRANVRRAEGTLQERDRRGCNNQYCYSNSDCTRNSDEYTDCYSCNGRTHDCRLRNPVILPDAVCARICL